MTDQTLPEAVSRETWLSARKDLLAAEKQATKARDALNTRRRLLPMVRVDKEYALTGPDGPVALAGLFDGRRQLVVQHFMFAPDWDKGCSACTAHVDELSDGVLTHINARETSYAVVARAPYPKLAAYREERGWTVPFFSSYGTDFNYDFNVTLDPSVAPVSMNYRGAEELREAGMDWALDPGTHPAEHPGLSCFLAEGGAVFHTYSTFARGTELTTDAYGLLDLTALGRQEAWELPKGRGGDDRTGIPDFS